MLPVLGAGFARAGIVPGGGPSASDCYVAADITGVETTGGAVQAGKRVTCVDGDACDVGGCGDDVCTMRIAVCVNQSGASAGCTPPAELDRLKVKGKLGLQGPTTLAGAMCGTAADVDVAVKVRRNGRKKAGKAAFKMSAVAPKGTKPRKDNDKIQIICQPRTDACPVTTTTTPATSTTTSTVPAPTLTGLDPNKPMILPFQVQAAYNDDTMFFHLSWEGDRGDTHDYLRFFQGAWRVEGGPRRDAQATIDQDPLRGPTNVNSTIYESRVAFMLNDPSGPNAVTDFGRYGCFLTCHNDNRAMPLWQPPAERTKYLDDGTAGSLDLWHHRLARANPIGVSDDQFVSTVPPGAEETGGRIGDAGDAPFQTNDLVGGVPTFAFDPATTGGLFAFPFEQVFVSPLRFFRAPGTPALGPGPVPVGIPFADAVAQGYVPQADDTIPRRRLRTPTGSHGDITAFGTTFTPSDTDPLFGRIDSNIQRLLDTGNPDDTALADGGVYDIAFAVHIGQVTVRDHYVSFPMRLSLGGGAADIQAVQIAGTGRGTLPDFTDTTMFPVKQLNLFLPGITSLSFVRGDDTALVLIDPQTNSPIDQTHFGSTALLTMNKACRDCHVAAVGDPLEPPSGVGTPSGAMELLVPQRGGVNTPTPLPAP